MKKALETFAELQASLLDEAVTQVSVEDVILFEQRLELVSKNRTLTGTGDSPALDGGLATSLFWLRNTALRLEDVTLQYGRSGVSGGCAQAWASTLVLVRVLVFNCASDFDGGAFYFADNSWLFASQTAFHSNLAARRGGVVYFSGLKSKCLSSIFFHVKTEDRKSRRFISSLTTPRIIIMSVATGLCHRRASKPTAASSNRTTLQGRYDFFIVCLWWLEFDDARFPRQHSIGST